LDAHIRRRASIGMNDTPGDARRTVKYDLHVQHLRTFGELDGGSGLEEVSRFCLKVWLLPAGVARPRRHDPVSAWGQLLEAEPSASVRLRRLCWTADALIVACAERHGDSRHQLGVRADDVPGDAPGIGRRLHLRVRRNGDEKRGDEGKRQAHLRKIVTGSDPFPKVHR
jgi:hypothetical protein